ncbi:hypothetical protein [Massilia genomosp. 1]|uniref:Gp5/Type VI secretion system Vgr protein OB-fold domain-containing protein n=1 Tax=Massilia genomosp. 1 TaxID=2609280 RepID=A0ABX0MNI1_9BURK|nr:hypothetical protein [Massilia genomosp. 1]NHZ64328.1 hypothetical protein [Massilia genomosp. 1]
MLNKASSAPVEALFEPGTSATATLTSVAGSGCEIEIAARTYRASVSPHLLHLIVGQQVAALFAGDAGWLVYAAWPAPGHSSAPLRFDEATGTLCIDAARLTLAALASIELRCGDALLRLSLDGRVHLEGMEIVSAAVGSNRIEGASIDLN